MPIGPHLEFISWVEDFAVLLPGIPIKTFALITDQNKKLWVVALRAQGVNIPKDTYVTATLEGELYEIQGVITIMDLYQVVKDPWNSLFSLSSTVTLPDGRKRKIKSLLKRTLEDIFYLEEMGEYRQADLIDKLVKNEPISEKSYHILLNFLKDEVYLPFKKDPATGADVSGIQMVKLDSRASTIELADSLTGKIYTDRSIVEDNLKRDLQIRPYEEFAANFKNLAIQLNSDMYRGVTKNKALVSSHRAIASSLGWDLDGILDVFGPGTTSARIKREGRFHAELKGYKSAIEANGGKIDFLLNDDRFILKCLGISGRNLTTMEKLFARRWLKEEEFMMRFDLPGLHNQWKGEVVAKKWNAMGFSPNYNGQVYYKGTPGVADFGTAYHNVKMDGYLAGDYRNFLQENAQEMQDFIVAHRAELMAEINKHVTDRSLMNDRLKTEATTFEGSQYAYYIGLGYTPYDARRYARDDADNHMKDKAKVVISRTEDILLASRYAEKMHYVGVISDVYKSIESGTFVQRLLDTRTFSDLVTKPLLNTSVRSIREYVAPLDVNKLDETGIFKELKWSTTNPSVKAISSGVINGDPMAIIPLYILYSLNIANKGPDNLPFIMRDNIIINPLFWDKIAGVIPNPIAKPARALLKEGRSYIEFQVRNTKLKDVKNLPLPLKPLKLIPFVREAELPYGAAMVKNKEMKGIFNAYGVYDVLETVYGADDLFTKYGAVDFMGLSATDMMHNLTQVTSGLGQPAHLDNFYKKLFDVERYITTGTTAPNSMVPYFNIARDLGLIAETSAGSGVFAISAGAYKALHDSHTDFFVLGLGDAFFKKLEALGMHRDDRYKFMRELKLSGLADQVSKMFTGPIEAYNKYANMVQKWFLSNVVFNPKLSTTFFIGPILFRPMQAFLKRLGFSDNLSILATVSRWKWVSAIETYGEALYSLAKYGNVTAGVAAKMGWFSTTAVKIMRIIRPFREILKFAAKAISNLAAPITFGISLVLTTFSDAIFTFTWNIIKLQPKKAVTEATGKVVKTTKTILKITSHLVWYTIACCTCCVGCFVYILIIIVVIIGSMITSYDKFDEYTGPDATALTSIAVTKFSAYNKSNDSIDYTITIKNNSNKELTIDSYKDEMTFTYPCDSTKGTVNYGTADFIGKVDDESKISPTYPNVYGQKLAPAQSIIVTFKLKGVNSAKGTYTNDASVTVKEESGKVARGTTRNDVNGTGCFKCPEGWPSQTPLYVMQGPWAGYSHSKVEAVDLGPSPVGSGRTVIATHSGKVYPNAADTEVYGYNALIESSDGHYRTIYGHMVAPPSFSQGQEITAGTTLGIMGTTGHSSGVHVHYEFGDVPYTGGRPQYQCIPGHPLKLEQVQGRSYVPKTIPVACQEDACGGIVN